MKNKPTWLFLVLILLLGYSCQVNGQETTHHPCSVLEKAVKTKIFQKIFDVCAGRTTDLLIVDTVSFFSDCYLSSVCERKVLLNRVKEIKDPKNQDLITLYRADYDTNIYALYFVRRYTGATVKLFLRQKKKKVKLIKFEWGAF